MPRSDIKTYGNYREGVLEQGNEPEEGEIVDDYELIVSSDEELSMRQRIRELEAENAEIEQIAVISRSYDDEFKPLRNNLDKNRAARVPTDASSISSTEFVTPKKRKRRKSKERKRKHCHHHHQHHRHQRHEEEQLPQYNAIKTHSHTRKTQCKRRQKIIAKKHAKVHSDRYVYKEISNDSVNLDDLDSSASTLSLTDDEMSSKNVIPYNRKDDVYNYGSYITRDTLRFAVARNSTDSRFTAKKSCLKDKLLKQELVSSYASNVLNDEDVADDDADDDVEVIEPEVDIQTVDEDSLEDSMEEKELRLIALKSAVLKKHMARKRRNAEAAYSPTDFDNMLASGILQGKESKLVGIDVVDLEDDDSQNGCVIISPEASPQLMMLDDQEESQQMMDCKPVDMDLVNSDSEDAIVGNWSKKLPPTFSYASHEFAKQFQYSMYIHEIELPPPPPGVDDYEELPPPPPCFKTYNAELQDMELDNEELMEEVTTEIKTEVAEVYMQPEATSATVVKHKEEKVEEEEEEEALRALLLSKFQSPKNPKKNQLEQNRKECKDSNSNEIESRDKSKIEPKKPTEFILKEAVKRLKIHSQTDILKEETSVDQQQKDYSKENNFKLHDKMNNINEEHSESMISLGALRKRLTELKNQPIESDEFINEKEGKQKLPAKNNHETLEVETETENTITNNDMFTVKEATNEHLPSLPDSSDANSTMTTNCVDISDITRRLQKLKDEILSATAKQKPQEETQPDELIDEMPQGMTNSTLTMPNSLAENKEEIDSNKQILENMPPTHKSFHNNVDNIVQTENDHKVLNKHKIVKADFDATKNITTFKVTISNSAALRAEDKEITTATEDSSLKENNVNVNCKNTNITINDLPKAIAKSQGNKSPEIKNITTKSKTSISRSQIPITGKVPVTALPTFPALRSTKIVKPNKVINNNLDLKRKLAPQTTDTTLPSKISKTEPPVKKTDHKSRLITSMDQVKHMCKIPQFVISVQNSSNESSDDEWGDYDSFYKPLYDYNDNASPLSLNLESPCRTPVRSNSPIETTAINQKETGFEEKLDKFLKTVRTTVQTENLIEKTPQSASTKQSGKTNKTPLAVRHLPAAAQSEYRRLVHRMKLLENQRMSTKVTENTIDTKEQNQSSDETNKAENDTATGSANNSVSKTSLVKQVLIRNANNNSTTSEAQANGSTDSGPPKFPKTNVLHSYENLYVKFGAGIVNNLDKSLKLVEEAKKAKISKLKLENRLKELKAEMDVLQTKHKEEQQKISRIYPSICTTNDVIASLKQKRSKVFKAALNLGKTLKGEEYRLNNDLKQSITTKTKQLDSEIKLVNSLKAQDIANIEDLFQKNKTKEVSENEKEEEKEKQDTNTEAITQEDMKSQQSPEKKEELNSILNNTVCAEDHKQKVDDTGCDEDHKGEDDDATALPTTQFSSNTEFQNMDPGTPKIPKNDKESPELATGVDTANEFNNEDCKKQILSSYISPLEHLRNMDSNMDPNGVVCPYDLMGNCEDATCKYVHISPKEQIG